MKNRIYEKDHTEITEDNGKYEISWEFGFTDYRRYFEITKENAERAMKSDEDLKAVMLYAETGHWPSTKTQEEISREFLLKCPHLLIRIPKNQNHFTEAEIKEILPNLDRKKLKDEESKYLDELLKKYNLPIQNTTETTEVHENSKEEI